MIGPAYWSTGIKLTYVEPYGTHGPAWSGEVEYFDDGFADDDAAASRISTQGRLATRYAVEGEDALTSVVGTLLRDAARLGIVWQMQNIYWGGDGDAPPLPYRSMLIAQAERIGWRTMTPEREAELA